MPDIYTPIPHVLMNRPELLQDPDNRERMKKLLSARIAFMSGFIGSLEQQLSQERVYHDYYVDIVNHEDFWFSTVFKTSEYSEWTVGILGTLATIRRQRGDVRKCLQVLQMDTKVLKVYQDIVDRSIPAELDCVRALTYKYNLIVINANSQVGNRDVAVKAFREAVQYEIEEGYEFEQQNFGHLLQHQPDNIHDDYMTMVCLNSTTDDFIWSILQIAQDFSEPSSDLGVDPWICDGCGAVEDMCGDFQQCSGCKKAKYCGKACQVKHWKTFHKAECKKKKKNAPRPKLNVTNTDLKEVANILLRNFAITVAKHTGQEVSDEQKQAAFPGLVQFLKDFLASRPEFSISSMAFQDATRDADFIAKSQAFFEEQAGFEALLEIHQKPEVRAHVASILSADKSKELMVDEGTINEVSKQFVTSMAGIFCLSPDHVRRMVEKLTSTVTRYILDHPEYNSYQGFQELKATDECKALFKETGLEFVKSEGLLTSQD